MIINHLIVGARDAETSADFYCTVLGFERETTFIDTGTGAQGIVLKRSDGPQVLIVPFAITRLPNPQHIAFEVDANTFESIYRLCKERSLRTRSAPPLNWAEEGIGFLDSGGKQYRNFYVVDPANVNVEIMTVRA
jgi:catechol 2,3-dioxygenase-like lactoylglutathione lyase family enzyme